MALSVCKTIHMGNDEMKAFERRFGEGVFFDRVRSGHDVEEIQKRADANRARALRRVYGYPAFRVTGTNNDYTLNLGFWVD